ncbi:MAG: isochorismatase family protein [Candidatus Nanopelagicaceae bacterium]
MHKVGVRQHIVDRVIARRKKYHWFNELDASKTALVVIDMQNTFCEPNSPAEVPQSRDIVNPINKFAKSLRDKGGQVIWVLHANSQVGNKSDWELFFNNVVADEVKSRTIASLSPDKQKVWKDLTVDQRDITVIKNRYSALISGSSSLERVLRNLGIDTILIAGTKSNICCESTARDGMMLDFKIVMVEDCCAALSDDEHQATLESIIQHFGDVRTSESILEILN